MELIWHVTTGARGGAWGGGGHEAPPPTRCWGGEAPPQQLVGNINDDRDTQRESNRDTRNVRLAITINKAPGNK